MIVQLARRESGGPSGHGGPLQEEERLVERIRGPGTRALHRRSGELRRNAGLRPVKHGRPGSLPRRHTGPQVRSRSPTRACGWNHRRHSEHGRFLSTTAGESRASLGADPVGRDADLRRRGPLDYSATSGGSFLESTPGSILASAEAGPSVPATPLGEQEWPARHPRTTSSATTRGPSTSSSAPRSTSADPARSRGDRTAGGRVRPPDRISPS